MGLLGWLLFGALALGAVVLISEVVSYFLTGESIRNILIQKRSEGKLRNIGRVICKGNDGHKTSWQALENGVETDTIEVSSTVGTSSDIRVNQIIDF